MERSLSTDVLVEILRRLPPSARRRARLVCRFWRDVVGEHTTEMQSRAKPLLWNTSSAVAYVVDDVSPSSTGSCRQLWRTVCSNLQLVGSCNGLLCLCDNYSSGNKTGGNVTLVNPTTRETLAVPALPCARHFVGHPWKATRWDKAYSFGYHPTSGQYKVVHVPCSFDRVCEFDTLYVLTLRVGMEAMWREVLLPPRGTRCNLDAGVVCVDGVTHWVTVTDDGATARIVSFDLDSELITFSPTPRKLGLSDDYNLTEVSGRLGVVGRKPSGTRDAWVREKGRWIHRFSVKSWCQDIPRPNFAFGDYLLKREGTKLYGHRTFDWTWRDVLKVGYHHQGTLVAKLTGDSTCYFYDCYHTFAYVSTLEPLNIYSTKSS
jgi:F-box interacting protein